MRGEIVYRDRAKQIVDFRGLRYGTITPTDLDGYIDYQNKCAVFFELKHAQAGVPRGQEVALERLVDNCKLPSVAIIASHNVGDPVNDINAAAAVVSRYYSHGNWRVPKQVVNLRGMIDAFIKKYGGTQ